MNNLLNLNGDWANRSNVKLCNGTVLVLTLNAYNNFGYKTDFSKRKDIVYELLSTIHPDFNELVESRPLNHPFIFCLPGTPPCIAEIFKQYERMFTECNQKHNKVRDKIGKDIFLSFQMIAHYGSTAEYSVGNSSMLFGEAVVEAQQLADNSIDCNSYLLLTDQLLESINSSQEIPAGTAAGQICQVYGESVPLCFVYYDYST